ncbi:MAG: phosphoheptose isomerase [Marinilabiliales bacterium]|nr:MAG: phosphoheptose isomerase [Marinilabiliales bacterium]
MNISEIIKSSISTKERLLADENILSEIQNIASRCIKTLKSGGKILLCGNGGSASDAQHIAAELSGRFEIDRPPLYAEALHVNTSYLTAVANDYSFDLVYSRMIEAAGRKDDILIGLSTSGNSKNVVKAFEKGRDIGMHCFGLSGRDGGKMQEVCDINIIVPSDNTARIQESHILIGHIICQIIENELFAN